MQAEQFAYWLQGFVELNGDMPTPEQWQSIKDHLATVFVKVTPRVGPSTIWPNDPTKVPRLGDWPIYQPQITCSAIDMSAPHDKELTRVLNECVSGKSFASKAIC